MDNEYILALKVILGIAFMIMVIAGMVKNKRVKEEDQNHSSADATPTDTSPSAQPAVDPPSRRTDLFSTIRMIVSAVLVLVIFAGIVSKINNRSRPEPIDDQIAELNKLAYQMQRTETDPESDPSATGTGHYPGIAKGTATYVISLHSVTNNMTMDDTSLMRIDVRQIVKDTIYISAKMIYKADDQVYEGKRTHYRSTKSPGEMNDDERFIHVQFQDLLRKDFEYRVDNEGNISTDGSRQKAEATPQHLYLGFLFSGLPPDSSDIGARWHRTFIEGPLDKYVKMDFTITDRDHATITAQVRYSSHLKDGMLPCAGLGHYYLDRRTLLVDSANIRINIGSGDNPYFIRINRI